jgi:succinate dehydrogenase / fumarate reductase, cytochrome b subunit
MKPKTLKKPPVYLDLLRIRLPVGAVTSLLHRVSGVMLALSLPAALYALDLSLRDPGSYEQVLRAWDSLGARLAVLLMLWALAHHLLAGARFLLIDLGVGVRLRPARAGAWAVNAAAALLVLLAAAVLLP